LYNLDETKEVPVEIRIVTRFSQEGIEDLPEVLYREVIRQKPKEGEHLAEKKKGGKRREKKRNNGWDRCVERGRRSSVRRGGKDNRKVTGECTGRKGETDGGLCSPSATN